MDVLFQILLRGANAMGYTSYPNNILHHFCKQYYKSSVDVFRVFDSLNYIKNLNLDIDAAGSTGGFVEVTLSYTGNVSNPNRGSTISIITSI